MSLGRSNVAPQFRYSLHFYKTVLAFGILQNICKVSLKKLFIQNTGSVVKNGQPSPIMNVVLTLIQEGMNTFTQEIMFGMNW